MTETETPFLLFCSWNNYIVKYMFSR